MTCTLLRVLCGLYTAESSGVCATVRWESSTKPNSGMTSRIADDRIKRCLSLQSANMLSVGRPYRLETRENDPK